GGFGAFFVVESFRHAPVAVIAPFDYSGLVWAALFGFVLWDDVPGPAVLAGAAVIVASNLYIIRREARGSIAVPPPPRRPA
ncbi:MAG: EamA/RhaT family transporter, partial [Alphaproteobacteria bacterium]